MSKSGEDPGIRRPVLKGMSAEESVPGKTLFWAEGE